MGSNVAYKLSLVEAVEADADRDYPYPPLDGLLEKIPNGSRFGLIMAAANRARSILDAIVAITKRSTNIPEEIKRDPEAFLPKLSHYRNAYFDTIEMRYRGKLFVIALEEIYEGLIDIQYPKEKVKKGDPLLQLTLSAAMGNPNPDNIP